MAEVSELDAQMDAIIRIFYASPDKMKIFHNHITASREKSLHDSLEHPECKKECKLKWRNQSLDEIMPRIESSQRAHAIHQLLKEIDPENKRFNLARFKANYDNKIIAVRNNLAHCESDKVEGHEILKTRKGDLIFTNEDFKQIRKDIINYRKTFRLLLKYVTDDMKK